MPHSINSYVSTGRNWSAVPSTAVAHIQEDVQPPALRLQSVVGRRHWQHSSCDVLRGVRKNPDHHGGRPVRQALRRARERQGFVQHHGDHAELNLRQERSILDGGGPDRLRMLTAASLQTNLFRLNFVRIARRCCLSCLPLQTMGQCSRPSPMQCICALYACATDNQTQLHTGISHAMLTRPKIQTNNSITALQWYKYGTAWASACSRARGHVGSGSAVTGQAMPFQCVST